MLNNTRAKVYKEVENSMEHMKRESLDLVQENIKKIEALSDLFPNCVTEAIDKEKSREGEIVYKKVINFDMLKQMLSGDILEGNEAYEFNWVGKKASIVEANRPINKTLRPCKEESVDWDTTENLYIEGDNLEVLKMLQESYLGKVKMIYIDPPYNTGNDFIYNDDFKMSSDEYAEEAGEVDEEGNRMVKNSKGAGRFHSDWCSMIYSRLMVARNLLADDGVIFISIDDNEVSNLRSICDELFGESNFIGEVNWHRNYASANDSKTFSNVIDYILVYSKSDKFTRNLLPRTEKQNSLYKYDSNDGMGRWRSDNLSVRTYSALYDYPIMNPNTKVLYNPPAGRSWMTNKETMERWIAENRVFFGQKGDGAPQLKRYLNEVQAGVVPTTYWGYDECGHNDEARKELKALFNQGLFTSPKPTRLLERAIRIGSNQDDIILDFFSGSATTAHAVMQLNAEDGGNRKFIMVQLPEKTDEKSEAYKAGYKNICEIGKERIRRAAAKIREDNPDATFDGGFRVLKVDSSNMKDVYLNPSEYSQNMLEGLESNIKEDRTDLDLLFDAVLRGGLELSMSYESDIIEDFVIHNYDDGSLVACFEDNLTPAIFEAIAKMKPLKAVFKDEGFTDSAAKTNATEIFKRYSPDTKVRVI